MTYLPPPNIIWVNDKDNIIYLRFIFIEDHLIYGFKVHMVGRYLITARAVKQVISIDVVIQKNLDLW